MEVQYDLGRLFCDFTLHLAGFIKDQLLQHFIFSRDELLQHFILVKMTYTSNMQSFSGCCFSDGPSLFKV